jgi:hypothetical protein
MQAEESAVSPEQRAPAVLAKRVDSDRSGNRAGSRRGDRERVDQLAFATW